MLCRCLEEGAEDFIVKPVKLSDVKRLKGYMTTKEVNGGGVVGINNKRKLPEEPSDLSSSSPPSISSSPSPSSTSPSSSSPSSSPSVLDSPIRRLKMTGTTDWLSVLYSSKFSSLLLSAAAVSSFPFLLFSTFIVFLLWGSNCNYPLLVITVFVALPCSSSSYLWLIYCFFVRRC